MRKNIAVIVINLLLACEAIAAGSVGQCVYPKTVAAKNGSLKFRKPVHIASAPNSESKQVLGSLSSFSIKAEIGSYIQLATVPNYDKPNPDQSAGKIVGWAKLSDFEFQDQRSCN